MNINYGTEIPQSSLNQIISKAEETIRLKQICKDQLPLKCGAQIKNMIAENVQNLFVESQQRYFMENKAHIIPNLKNDNLSPFLVKRQKDNDFVNFYERLSFDAKSRKTSSALKSRRDQYTASTDFNKRQNNLNKTYGGLFLDQTPWTQTQCRKRYSRTAQGSRGSKKPKYISIKGPQKKEEENEVDEKRKELDERKDKQKTERQKIEQSKTKLKYQRRLLQQQFENAKLIDKKKPSQRKKQTNQIVNFEVQNGTLLTNRFLKAPRKTIEHIINLQYKKRGEEKIAKKQLQREFDIENIKKRKCLIQMEKQKQQFVTNNKNYNNGGTRQISLIPYVMINPGICLSESSIQATISRARPSEQISRQKFFSTIQNKTFKSYSKDCSPQRLTPKQTMTIDVCETEKKSKSSYNNESFRKSILWGSRISKESHQIKIEKQEYVKELMQ